MSDLDPSLAAQCTQPLDLTNHVHKKTAQKYMELVARIWKCVLEIFLHNSSQVPLHLRNDFLKGVVRSLACECDGGDVSLAVNVLESLRDFFSMASKSKTRGAIATRKQIIQAVSGSKIRSGNQLSSLAEALGANRHLVVKEAKNRADMEEAEEIVPYLDILRRKSPEGCRILSEAEQLEVIAFYEKSQISDVLKGSVEC